MSDEFLDLNDLVDEREEDTAKNTDSNSSPPIITITLDTEIGGWVEYDDDGSVIGRGRTIADAIIAQTTHKLAHKLRDEARKTIKEEVTRQIALQVNDLVTEVITNPIQLTNRFGELTGETLSVREHIANEVKDQLTRRRDSYDRNASVLSSIIKTEVEQALTKELREAVVEARNTVVAAVKNQAATMLAKALKDGLRD
jgi:hypothetical protein